MRLALSLMLAVSGCASVASAQPVELRKLHVLMVLDTSARELATSLQIDEKRVLRLWSETIPESRRSVTVLKGDQATRKDVLAYYDRLTLAPDEGLVFYYGGHGARDEKTNKPFFDLKKGSPLLREELLQAMLAKKAPLVVLLTDCCSLAQEFQGDLVEERSVRSRITTLQPTVRCLLFQARGLIDLTAATDNASWSDNLTGGLFTRSICRLLQEPIKTLDGNKDGFVTWREFYPQLRDETQSLFGDWRKKMMARGEKVGERKQMPHAYALGQVSAVVGIENATKKPLAYRVRWTGQEDWSDVTLRPGEKKVHALRVPASRLTVPELEASLPGVRTVRTLKAREWVGDGEPKDLAMHYRIRPRGDGNE